MCRFLRPMWLQALGGITIREYSLNQELASIFNYATRVLSLSSSVNRLLLHCPYFHLPLLWYNTTDVATDLSLYGRVPLRPQGRAAGPPRRDRPQPQHRQPNVGGQSSPSAFFDLWPSSRLHLLIIIISVLSVLKCLFIQQRRCGNWTRSALL